jgi:predicted nucleic acid-binding protein
LRKYVFDSSAILNLLLGEQNSGKVAQLIKDAHTGSATIAMSVVNWGEAYYSIFAKAAEEDVERVTQSVRRLPLSLVTVDAERCERAGRLKVRHNLGYADAFAAELAMERKAVLVTSDSDFKRIQGQVKILWINRKN